MLGFIFGEGTDATSPETLRRRRELIDRLGQQSISGTPTNLGQGINAIGQALFSRIGDSRLAPREDAARDDASEAFAQIVAQLGGGMPVMPSMAPQIAPAAPMAAPVGPQAVNPLPVPPPVTAAPLPPQIGAAVDRVQGLSSGPAGMPMPPQGVDTLAGGAGNDRLQSQAAFPASLIQSESGGNWNALNNEQGAGGRGHGGRLQFGHARLQDAANAGVVQPMTPQEFARQPPEVQMAVENWHFADIDRQAQRMGLDRFIGQTVAGIPITQDGIRAMAHLGGIGGAQRFLESGGRHNPSDSFGTSLADYAQMHGSGGGAMTGGGGVPAMLGGPEGDSMGGGNMAVIMQLADLMSNPYMPEGQRMVAQALIDQQIAGMDPMRMMEMERARLELEQLRNPQMQPIDAPSSVQEYEYYAAQEAAAGRQPLSYAEFSVMDEQAGLPPTGPMMGTIPQGFTAIADPNEPSGYRMVPIAGGPEDTTAQDAQALDNQSIASDTVVQAAQYAREALEDRMVPGVLAPVAGLFPNTASAEVNRQVDTLKSMAIVSNLQAMRDASPTGGALGAVTAPELKMLADQAGALDSRSPNFARDLENYERTLLRVIHGTEEGERIFAATRPNAQQPAADGATTINGYQIRQVN